MKRLTALILSIIMLMPIASYTAMAKSDIAVTLSKTSYTYNGEAKKPSVTVKYNGKVLKSSNYTVKYPPGRVNVGKYTVTVTLKGNYSGKKNVSFSILPVTAKIKSASSASKSITLKWSKVSAQASGYQIRYSTSSSFKSCKTISVKGNSNTEKTITSLKPSTKYYIQIRTFKNVGDDTFFSNWSDTTSFTTRKTSSGGSSTAPEASSGVYITPTGACYHFSKSCAGKNAKETTLKYAKSHYRACKKCAG